MDFTDNMVFTYTKNRVNPCNPCLKTKISEYRNGINKSQRNTL